MKKILMTFFTLVLAALLTTGCANHATSSVSPSSNMSAFKMVYIKKIPSDENTHVLIADKLRSKGLVVSTGLDAPSSNVDAIVTYIDKWMWDMSMYMLELTITFRDPKTDSQIATGNSYHASLTRKSPKDMVNEVIENIYKDVH